MYGLLQLYTNTQKARFSRQLHFRQGVCQKEELIKEFRNDDDMKIQKSERIILNFFTSGEDRNGPLNDQNMFKREEK